MLEGSPGKEKLQAFKNRLDKLVVRDIFTTPDMLAARVTASLGRYLLFDPRRHNFRGPAEHALASLVDVAAALFVDLMRLLNVAGGDHVRTVNSPRYGEFVDMADQHFADFRIQVTRLAGATEAEIARQCMDLENSFGWSLTRLRRGPELDRSWAVFATLMAGLGERVHLLGETAAPSYYASRRGELLDLIDQTIAHRSDHRFHESADRYVGLRHVCQNLILAKLQATSTITIATVRDDIDRVLAIPYFTVDLVLLRQRSAAASAAEA
jgi:hypothetical protein